MNNEDRTTAEQLAWERGPNPKVRHMTDSRAALAWPLEGLAGTWPPGYSSCAVIGIDLDAESVDLGASPAGNLGGRYSHGRYAVRAGAWNLMDRLEARALRATFFVPGWDAEQHPTLIEAIAARGHEVAAHGFLHEDHSKLGTEQMVAVERSRDAIASVLGSVPRGWRAPGGLTSAETLQALARAGFDYDASYFDSDLPYTVLTGDRSLVEIPQFPFLSDAPFYRSLRHPDDVRQFWTEEFEAIRDAGLLFSLKLHARGDTGSARGVRLEMLDAFLGDIAVHGDVWMPTYGDLATWWAQEHQAWPRVPMRTP